MEVIHGREDALEWPVIEQLLATRVQQINSNGVTGPMDSYYVEELFKKLRKRGEVSKIDLARWEYNYLPMFEHRDLDLTVFELMASDPEFFVSVLTDIFVADGTNPDEQEPSEDERSRATASYRLLINLNRGPAEKDGIVDPEALDRWVNGVLEAAAKAKRLNIAHANIGRSLAHSAERDGVWPQAPVAAVIERMASPELEKGLMIERYNMRGVYSKSMFEGGKQERDLAEQYRRWKSSLPPGTHRTAAMLEAIAAHWDEDAKRADEAAARDRLLFE
jgi:hypothetical protein